MAFSTKIGCVASGQDLFLGPFRLVSNTTEVHIFLVLFPKGQVFRFGALNFEANGSGCLHPCEGHLCGSLTPVHPALWSPTATVLGAPDDS